MILHPVIQSLKKLRLNGFVEALELQNNNLEIDKLRFEERLALLVDHETCCRDNKKLQLRLRKAKFRDNGNLADLIYESSRKLDKRLVQSLETCDWVVRHQNIIITGATGTGKSYLGEALAHQACLRGFGVLRVQFPRILHQLRASKADGSYLKLQNNLAQTDVLLMDDFGIVPLSEEQRQDLFEIIDDRNKSKSTVITSQLPIEQWHGAMGEGTMADAILDRLVHSAHRIALEGESMRKKQKKSQEN